MPTVPKKPVPKEKVSPAVPKKVEAPPAKGMLSSRRKEYAISQLLFICSVLLPIIDLYFCEFCCSNLVTMNHYSVWYALHNRYKNIISKYSISAMCYELKTLKQFFGNLDLAFGNIALTMELEKNTFNIIIFKSA